MAERRPKWATDRQWADPTWREVWRQNNRQYRRARLKLGLIVLVLAALPMATVNVLGEVRARYQQQQAVKAAAEARREARLEKLRAEWRAEAKAREAREKAHPPKASQASYQDPASLGRLTAAAILARGGAGSSTAECWAAYNEYTADTTSGPPALDPDDLGGAATFVNACQQALAEAGF
jgi:hypothetical protein